MSRPRRILASGAYYHVYNRGVEKRSLFLDEHDRRCFIHTLAETVVDFQARLFCYCLMENHFHLFLQTLEPNLNRAIQSLQGRYGQYFNLRHQRVGKLFQDRYKSRLVDKEAYGLALARYIHRNPLDAGIVRNLEDYRWSSYLSYCGTLPKWTWLNTEWLLSQFGTDADSALQSFLHFHTTPPPDSEAFLMSRTGSPLIVPEGSDP